MPEMSLCDSMWKNGFFLSPPVLASPHKGVKTSRSIRWKLVCFEANTCVSGERLYDELMVYGNFYANSSHLTFFLREGEGLLGKNTRIGNSAAQVSCEFIRNVNLLWLSAAACFSCWINERKRGKKFELFWGGSGGKRWGLNVPQRMCHVYFKRENIFLHFSRWSDVIC